MKQVLIVLIFILTTSLYINAQNASKGVIKGTVVDAEGKPLEKAWIYYSYHSGVQTTIGNGIMPWSLIGSAKAPLFERGGYVWYGPARSKSDGTFKLVKGSPTWKGQITIYHPKYCVVLLSGSEWKSRGPTVEVGKVILKTGFSVTGTVTDETGGPIANAIVGIQDMPFINKGKIRFVTGRACIGDMRSVRTDAQGKYIIKGLKPDSYMIAAWTGTLPPVEYEIKITKEVQSFQKDFKLAAGDSIFAAVTYTHDGKPFPHAYVSLRRIYKSNVRKKIGYRNNLPLADEPLVFGYTDDKGKIQFKNLKPGKYYVTAIPSDWVKHIGSSTPERYSMTTAVNTGEEAKLQLEPVTPLHVIVVSAEDGQSVPECKVNLKNIWQKNPPNKARNNRGEFSKTVKTAGKLEFEKARPGPWKVEVLASGYYPEDVNIIIPETGLEKPVKVVLKPTQKEMSGIVLDEEGKPLDNVEVMSYEWFRKYGWGNRQKARTDAQGCFCLKGLYGGLGNTDGVWIKFSKPGYVEKKIDFDHKKSLPKKLDQTRLVKLTKTGTIKGVVLNVDGNPAEAYEITLQVNSKFPPRSRSDKNGCFIFKDLAPGTYRVSDYKNEIEVLPGKTSDVKIFLKKEENEKP